MDAFQAIVVREVEGEVTYARENITLDQLSEGEVLIKVAYSSVNYKDCLAVKTKGGVIRDYPMIPGIDLSGTVVSSASPAFAEGQAVLVTGFQVGMSHTGGFAEYARIPAKWVVSLPENLTLREAMVIGTAGFTAALSVMALERAGMKPQDNPEILVTGPSGGVGSIAVQLLAKSGYQNIHALAREPEEEAHLKALGATNVVLARDIIPEKSKALDKQRFHYVLDVVGGEVASALVAQIYYGGAMSMCGNAGGVKFNATVMPFILRGVSVVGVDSVSYPIEKRDEIWNRFAGEWHIMGQSLVQEITMNEMVETIQKVLAGQHVGRHIVKIG